MRKINKIDFLLIFMDIKIRKAVEDDVKIILEFNQELFDYEYENFDKTLDCQWPPNNKNYFKNSINKDNSVALVAVDGKKVVGYLVGCLAESEDYRKISKIAEIDNMFVISEYRNKGVGSFLCEEFFNWVRSKGIRRAKVIVSAKNESAIAFYKKCGFSDYNYIFELDVSLK
ncbi:GNAT family N-acetyltransferase [Candidatus Pacearchaeota archaeon]|nr:GNAT family N-acetyltransferase [Candidatus Pacearchaeota archaeon]